MAVFGFVGLHQYRRAWGFSVFHALVGKGRGSYKMEINHRKIRPTNFERKIPTP